MAGKSVEYKTSAFGLREGREKTLQVCELSPHFIIIMLPSVGNCNAGSFRLIRWRPVSEWVSGEGLQSSLASEEILMMPSDVYLADVVGGVSS